MKRIFSLLISYAIISSMIGQERFNPDPYRAEFITSDYEHFWQAFDSLDISDSNPFEVYLKKASAGLQPMVQYIDAEIFYNTVLDRREDYTKTKGALNSIRIPILKCRI